MWQRRVRKGRARRGLVWVLALAVVAGGCAAQSTSPTLTPARTLPGSPGHFNNGEMAFDYPADWPVLAYGQSESCGVIYVLVVLGNGRWSAGTNQPQPNGAILCGMDSVSVPPTGIVVRVWWRGGGPAPMCVGDTRANATVGPNAVRKSVDGAVTSWELRVPGGEFNMPNNPVFEAHTVDPVALAAVESMVASFRWESGAPSYAYLCSPAPS